MILSEADGVDQIDVLWMTVFVMSMDTARTILTLLNVEQLVYKNHHVLAMLYQHNNIPTQIDVMFMETFRRQIRFLDGTLDGT